YFNLIRRFTVFLKKSPESNDLGNGLLDITVQLINYPHITTQSRNGHKKRLVAQLKRRFNKNDTSYMSEDLRKVMVRVQLFIILVVLILISSNSNACIEYYSNFVPDGTKRLEQFFRPGRDHCQIFKQESQEGHALCPTHFSFCSWNLRGADIC
ncbi:hypothetical protein CEXT_490731, partial [Caerostris extrusa]